MRYKKRKNKAKIFIFANVSESKSIRSIKSKTQPIHNWYGTVTRDTMQPKRHQPTICYFDRDESELIISGRIGNEFRINGELIDYGKQIKAKKCEWNWHWPSNWYRLYQIEWYFSNGRLL